MNDTISELLPRWGNMVTMTQGLLYAIVLSAFLGALALSEMISEDLRSKIVIWGMIAELAILLGLVLTTL